MTGNLHNPVDRAFTMIEIVVVIVLLSVVSGIVLPRLVSTGARNAQVEAQSARAVLSAAAQRDALSSQAMALFYSDDTRELTLAVQASTGDADVEVSWIPAALVRPARFESGVLRSVAIDGRPMAARAWRVEFSPSQPRPALSLLVVFEGSALGGAAAWQVDLAPDATAAVVTPLHSADEWRPVLTTSSQDLDAQGRRSTPW